MALFKDSTLENNNKMIGDQGLIDKTSKMTVNTESDDELIKGHEPGKFCFVFWDLKVGSGQQKDRIKWQLNWKVIKKN